MMSACAASSLVGLYLGPRSRSPSTPPARNSATYRSTVDRATPTILAALSRVVPQCNNHTTHSLRRTHGSGYDSRSLITTRRSSSVRLIRNHFMNRLLAASGNLPHPSGRHGIIYHKTPTRERSHSRPHAV